MSDSVGGTWLRTGGLHAVGAVTSGQALTRIRYNWPMGRIRPYLGDLVEDDELYVGPTPQMPTMASSLVVQARIRTGLSQQELAVRAGVSRSAISAIEHGRRDPGLQYLQRILRAAGFDLRAGIAPHDDHDDVLKALGARLTPAQRRARNAAARQFVDELRAAPSRPLVAR
jgi:transcriptional regulator with XRE-family HTH domain